MLQQVQFNHNFHYCLENIVFLWSMMNIYFAKKLSGKLFYFRFTEWISVFRCNGAKCSFSHVFDSAIGTYRLCGKNYRYWAEKNCRHRCAHYTMCGMNKLQDQRRWWRMTQYYVLRKHAWDEDVWTSTSTSVLRKAVLFIDLKSTNCLRTINLLLRV